MKRAALLIACLVSLACGGVPPTPIPSVGTPPPGQGCAGQLSAGATPACATRPADAASPTAAAATPTAVATPSPQPTTGASLLPLPTVALKAGTYTKLGFKPTITLTVGDGWTSAQAVRGFFDVEQDVGSPDVIAVQFANVDAESLGQAVEDVTTQPNTIVVDQGETTVDGRPGFFAVIETTDPADADPPVFRSVLNIAAGPMSIASGRRLKVEFVEASNGVLGVLIGGSIARWVDTLSVAQPVVDSVSITD